MIVLKNAKILLGGVDLSGEMNSATVEYNAESLDATTFGSSSRVRRGGLKVSTATGRGFFRSDTGNPIDQHQFDGIGLDDQVFTAFKEAIIEGSTSTGMGYAFKVTGARYSFGGAVGVLLPFDFTADGRGVGT